RPRELLDELRRVLVNLRRKIDRARGEGGHIGLEIQHPSTLVLAPATPARGELHDHFRTVLENSLLDLREKIRIGARAFVGVTHVNMGTRRSGIEGFARRFDLLAGGDWYSRRVGLARNSSGNRDSDYGGGRQRYHRTCWTR